METKSLPFEVAELKAAGDGWEVMGYASTFGGSPDSYGDIVAKGAFIDSLAKRDTVLLYQHEQREPIGKQIELKEDDHGLFGHWSLVPTTAGKDAHELLKHGLLNSLSIGFQTVDAEWNEATRILKKVDLFEVSIVTIPANANALITGFKASLPPDMPIVPLLKRAQEAVRVAGAEAKALHQRRHASGRSLNDSHRAALDGFLVEAEALIAELRGLVAVSPEAEASATEIEEMRQRLAGARMAIRRREITARMA